MLKHIENSNEVLFQDIDYRNILVFAALLHDIGKPVTTKRKKMDFITARTTLLKEFQLQNIS